MSRPEFVPFAEEHLAGADILLAVRHAAHRVVEPRLAERYADPEAARSELEQWWSLPGASGAVALDRGRVVGFLLGTPKSTEVWGPNMWVDAAGQAATNAEDLRDLYGVAAAGWVEEGRTAHYVVTPTFDPTVIDTWFQMGFGQQHVQALRASTGDPLSSIPDGVAIRRAERRDVEVLAELDLLLPAHQARSPVFSSGPVPSIEEARDDWQESIEDPQYGTFVAEVGGTVVGSAVGASAELSGIHRGLARPDHAAILGFAAVVPEERGGGVGQALGSAVLGWAAVTGYGVTVTDWRATNLLSSRTWPRLGFRPTFLRLHRVVGY